MTGPLDWASHSCPLTFSTLGVWAAGGEVTSVSRSGGLVAAGEEAGKVRLNIALVIHYNCVVARCGCTGGQLARCGPRRGSWRGTAAT